MNSFEDFMAYCPNCGKQNTSLLKDPNGKLYQLEDDFNQWIDNPKASPIENNIVLYTTFVCKDCGNLFAVGETDVNQKENGLKL